MFKEGQRVRVSQNLVKTENTWSTTSEMHEMKGKIFPIRRINIRRNIINGISISYKNMSYIFHPEDIIEIKPKKPDKSSYEFDPKRLIK